MWDFLTNHLLWWHWVALGLILITVEIFTGTFLMLGLGVAAMIVGEMENIFNLSLSVQLGLWIVLSLLSIVLWFKYLKSYTPHDSSGQSDYALGTQGVVIETIEPHNRGVVKFDNPILGNTEWQATANITIPKGARIKLINIKGQLIEVAPL